MFWFRLFYDTVASHARHDSDPEAAPILLSIEQLSWRKDFEPGDLFSHQMKLRYGERVASLRIYKPVSGITDEHVW